MVNEDPLRQRVAFLRRAGNTASGHGQQGPLATISRLSTPGWQHRFRTWSTRTFWQQRAALPRWADNTASGHGQRQQVAFLHWAGNTASGHGQPGPFATASRLAPLDWQHSFRTWSTRTFSDSESPFSTGLATQLQEVVNKDPLRQRVAFLHWAGNTASGHGPFATASCLSPPWADNAASGHGQQGPFATTSRPSTLGWQHSFRTWSTRTFLRQRVAFLHWAGNTASKHGQQGPFGDNELPFYTGPATPPQDMVNQDLCDNESPPSLLE